MTAGNCPTGPFFPFVRLAPASSGWLRVPNQAGRQYNRRLVFGRYSRFPKVPVDAVA